MVGICFGIVLVLLIFDGDGDEKETRNKVDRFVRLAKNKVLGVGYLERSGGYEEV